MVDMMDNSDRKLPTLKDKEQKSMINIAVNKLPHNINQALDSTGN